MPGADEEKAGLRRNKNADSFDSCRGRPIKNLYDREE